MKLKRVTTAEEADGDAIIVTLFLCRLRKVRGWFVGPISQYREGITVPYAARSLNLMAEVAVIRAKEIAEKRNLPMCIVDPDGLWERLWRQ